MVLLRPQRWSLVLVLVLLVGSTGYAWGQSGLHATVTVVHALPDFTADVYVNGKLTLSGFKPETATDPLQLPPGKYDLAIRDVGAAADSKPALAGTVQLKGGQNLSIIAGLTLDGAPHLNVFPNDLPPVGPGRARIVVRNVADVQPVDVRMDGDLLVQGVANGQERTKPVHAGRSSLEINASGEDTALVGPSKIAPKASTALIVYVVGSQDQGTLDLMAQTVNDLGSSVPDVLTGSGGLAATSGAWPSWAVALLVVGLIGLAGSIHALRRRWSFGSPAGNGA